MSDNVSMKLVCTGRGVHPVRELYYVKVHEGVIYLAKMMYEKGALKNGTARTYKPTRRGLVSDKPKVRHAMNIECPKCHRKPPMTTDHFKTLLDAGLSEVDISRLPW